jgi:hypothetical protein
VGTFRIDRTGACYGGLNASVSRIYEERQLQLPLLLDKP